MKKWMLTATVVVLAGLVAAPANAGDRQWATAGKILTGVAVGAVLAKSFDGPPAYASAGYGYAAPGYSVSYSVSTMPPCPPPPPVVYAPAPVVYMPAPVVYAPPVYYAPAPVYSVTYVHPGRGHGYGHGRCR